MMQPGTVEALAPGTRVPHVRLLRIDATPFDYDDIWQRRNLLLIALGAGRNSAADAAWLAALDAARPACEAHEAVVVVTRDMVPGLGAPGVVVADRWGEVIFVERAPTLSALPTAATLVEWLRFVDLACPECEGEAR